MDGSGRNYIRSERAHYMCPNMHFGILARILSPYDAEKLRGSVRALQQAHPFLRSLIAQDDGGALYYQAQESLEIPVLEKTDVSAWQRDYDALASRGWDVSRESLLRLLVYPGGDGFDVLFTVHHLLCDGRGLLQLVREFAEHYVKGVAPAFVGERLIASLDDLPKKADLPLISKIVVSDANRRWDRERHRVSYEEYLAFEKRFLRENPIKREIKTIGGDELGEILSRCRREGVSVNDWLIAKMMVEENTEKLVIAADIRRRVKGWPQGAMGNCSTAFSVSVRRKNDDLFPLAKIAAMQVSSIRREPQREMLVLACYLRMRPELLDAAAISALGGFDSAAGRFVGGRMFGYAERGGCCVTNLGKIESDCVAEAVFIPPASPANRITWGVLTVNGCMRICAAAPERD
ncbi:MAG: hypothetical protein K6F56_04730 [Oscillospiraceae bacterium]|nr:hypothetical protein [Oscillospiraceae bacterium]